MLKNKIQHYLMLCSCYIKKISYQHATPNQCYQQGYATWLNVFQNDNRLQDIIWGMVRKNNILCLSSCIWLHVLLSCKRWKKHTGPKKRILLGHCYNVKGCHIWSPSRIILSRHVTFDETYCPWVSLSMWRMTLHRWIIWVWIVPEGSNNQTWKNFRVISTEEAMATGFSSPLEYVIKATTMYKPQPSY